MVLESGGSEHGSEVAATAELETEISLIANSDDIALERLAGDAANSGAKSELNARMQQLETAGSSIVQDGKEISGAIVSVEEKCHDAA